MGPQSIQWNPNLFKRDPYFLDGTLLAEGTHVHRTVFRHLPLYYPSRVDCICLQQLLFAGHALSAF